MAALKDLNSFFLQLSPLLLFNTKSDFPRRFPTPLLGKTTISCLADGQVPVECSLLPPPYQKNDAPSGISRHLSAVNSYEEMFVFLCFVVENYAENLSNFYRILLWLNCKLLPSFLLLCDRFWYLDHGYFPYEWTTLLFSAVLRNPFILIDCYRYF